MRDNALEPENGAPLGNYIMQGHQGPAGALYLRTAGVGGRKGAAPPAPGEITLKTPWRGGTLAHCCCVCWRRPTVGVSEREAAEGALLSAGRSHGCSLKPERGAKCVRTTHKLLSTFSCLFLKAHGKAPERADAPGQSRCARGRPWPLRKPGRTSLPLYSRSGVWPPGGGH